MKLLIIILLFEVMLAIYRIRTKTIKHQVSLILRITSLIIIILLDAFSIIKWGWRYYLITLVLLLLSVISVVKFLCNKDEKVTSKKIILLGFRMLIIFFFSLLPAIIFPEYNLIPTTGNYKIETKVKLLIDENRIETYSNEGGPRSIVVEFWYPKDTNEDFPLIVFSHGAFGTRTSNETLYRELASHGYVICSIDHTYQCLYTYDSSGKLLLISREYFNEVSNENAKVNKENSLELYKKWMNVRVSDINFVIDTIKENKIETLYEIINTSKIGVIGHSLGGSAALGVGRLRSDISAVIALESPFMCDIKDVVNGEFVIDDAKYPIPVLNIYTDSSWSFLSSLPQYAKNVELLSGLDEDSFNLYLEGAGHLSLTDLSLASPILTRILNGHKTYVSSEDCLNRINKECLSFFDWCLKDKEIYNK